MKPCIIIAQWENGGIRWGKFCYGLLDKQGCFPLACLVFVVAGVSPLRRRPGGFAIAPWTPSRPPSEYACWDSSFTTFLIDKRKLQLYNVPYRQKEAPALQYSLSPGWNSNLFLHPYHFRAQSRRQPYAPTHVRSCGAPVARRSAQVCSPRKGSPEGSKTPLVRESRGADGPSGGVQGQRPCSPQAKPAFCLMTKREKCDMIDLFFGENEGRVSG